MHSSLSDKSGPIQKIIRQLADKLGATSFDIVDHWTDDAEAIGIAHPANHRILAYITPSKKGYYVALEAPNHHSSLPYQDLGSHQVKNIDALVAIVLMHFTMGHIAISHRP